MTEPAPFPLPPNFNEILASTEQRVRNAQFAHWRATNTFYALARTMTLIATLGGVAVSMLGALPLILKKDIYQAYEDWVGAALFVCGVGVSAVSILLAIMRWSERAESHQTAANAYSSLRRQLEVLRLGLPESAAGLNGFILQLARLSELSPAVPKTIWDKAMAENKRQTE